MVSAWDLIIFHAFNATFPTARFVMVQIIAQPVLVSLLNSGERAIHVPLLNVRCARLTMSAKLAVTSSILVQQGLLV